MLKELVNKFLSWPLPSTVCSDLCATMPNFPHRSGTTLLNATEAEEMLNHVVGDVLKENKAYKDLIDDCFSLTINLNDTFYYASADAETIDTWDLEKIWHIYLEHGRDALVAYVAIKRGHDPQIPKRITESYKLAKEKIQKIKDADEYFMDE